MPKVISILVTLSLTSWSATKVIERINVLEEKILSAQECSVSGDNDGSQYGSVGFTYIVTMKIRVQQSRQSTKVQIKKSITGRNIETIVPNSTRPIENLEINKTQSITYPVRYPSAEMTAYLLKACQDEMQFINTGAYPPPPPKPLPVIPPPEPKPQVPVTPELPTPVVPDLPVLPDLPGLPGVPGVPGTPTVPPENTTPTPSSPKLPTVPALPGELPIFPDGD